MIGVRYMNEYEERELSTSEAEAAKSKGYVPGSVAKLFNDKKDQPDSKEAFIFLIKKDKIDV